MRILRQARSLLLPAILIFFSLVAACDRSPRIGPLGPEAVVLAFGDSLTYGTGASREESYPAVLERLLGRRVVNAGVPGELSSEGVDRLPGLLKEYRPELVILIHGGNDFLRRRDPEQVKDHLRQMVELARESGADVILVGVPRLGLLLSAAPLYEEVSEEFHVLYEEDLLSDILAERTLKSDAIHPNAVGYALMAETLARRIAKAQGT